MLQSHRLHSHGPATRAAGIAQHPATVAATTEYATIGQ